LLVVVIALAMLFVATPSFTRMIWRVRPPLSAPDVTSDDPPGPAVTEAPL